MSETRRPEPEIVQRIAIGAAVLSVCALLVLPLVVVIAEALRNGLDTYVAALGDPDARAALRLSAITTVVVVLVNSAFGIAAAWAITKTRTRLRRVLLLLIDLPLAVSPVIAGMVFILVYGRRGWFGAWFDDHGVSIIFAPIGIILATVFVTLPLVARELIPLMEEQGTDEEQAAAVLGATSWQTFIRVTLPNIKWALLYGMILCGARAMGEFGAVSVVSGHIRGVTTTLPLHVEMLYSEYQFAAAFAVASVLVGTTLLTLLLQALLEKRREH